MIRRIAAAGFVLVALCAGGALAQQAADDIVTGAGLALPLDPQPPADTGKPRFFVPPPRFVPPAGCAAPFECRVRIIGEVRHNGAVELDAAVLKW